MNEPRFAVVGHPNKGKSSIVATLAADDSVAVARDPGTTTHTQAHPMRVDGKVLYTLLDTPGFQRARRAWDWMQRHETTADKRAQVVRDFVNEPGHAEAFRDEVELLRPLVDEHQPAGVLYVVDGSVPYGPEYEAEMDILRWTGQPSLALINPIHDTPDTAANIEAWRAALGQYFKVVRVFNALTAEFDKRLELLRAFGQLRDEWRAPLEQATQALQEKRDHSVHRSAGAIAELLIEALTHREQKKLGPHENASPAKPKLMEQFKGQMRRLERRARDQVEAAYDHEGLQRNEAEAPELEGDLFSEGTWLMFGLRRRDLVLLGVGGGATAGGMIDAATLGHSFLLGSAIGAVVGGSLAWMGAKKLAEVKLINQPMGGKLLSCGPVKSVNFPFVLFGRARFHHALVAGRSHAQRGALEITADQAGLLNPLESDRQRDLSRVFSKLGKSGLDLEERAEYTQQLTDLIEPILKSDEANGIQGS